MEATFDKLIPIVLELEGGYVDDPDDRGGRTAWGISERNHPNFFTGAGPTLDGAIEIYRQKYYLANKCDHLTSPAKQLWLFDAAVNQGRGGITAI